MKKILIALFILNTSVVYAGLTATKQIHESKNEVDREFTNIYLNSQPKQWVVFNTTPALNQLQDGQTVLVSSTNKGIAWRDRNSINFLTSSGALSTTNFITNEFSTNIYTTNNNYNTYVTTNIFTVNSSLWEYDGDGKLTPIETTVVDSFWGLDADNKLSPL